MFETSNVDQGSVFVVFRLRHRPVHVITQICPAVEMIQSRDQESSLSQKIRERVVAEVFGHGLDQLTSGKTGQTAHLVLRGQKPPHSRNHRIRRLRFAALYPLDALTSERQD